MTLEIHPDVRETPQTPENNILLEASRVTSGDRARYYGHPADNHANTAEFWVAYMARRFGIRVPLNSRDVCNMMVLLKVSRDANAPKRDNDVDICGYARNKEQIEQRLDKGAA